MSTTTQVKKVKINKMSKARYAQTTPVATELYMLTDVLDPQYDVLPTADAKYAGQITQYTGESVVGGYTNGYFYKCAAQGTSPETYAWEQTDVQPSGGGSSYTAGDGIDITSGVISVTAPVLKNTLDTTTYTSGVGIIGTVTGNGGVAIGGNSKAGNVCLSIGSNSNACKDDGSGQYAIALGANAKATVGYAIQIGYGTNSTAKTFCVGLDKTNNYTLLKNGGIVPAERLAGTTSATAGQVLTLDSNLNAVWASGGSGGAVDSVNGQTGTVVLDGGDINATVDGTTDSVEDLLQSLSDDKSGIIIREW